MAQTVRIDPAAHTALNEIARAKRLSLTEALARAIELYRRHLFLEQMRAGFAEVCDNKDAWAEEVEERRLWDTADRDGLDRE